MIIPTFKIQEPTYRYAKYLGSARPPIDPLYKLLIISHQHFFRNFYCAYAGALHAIRPPRDTIEITDNATSIGHLDHIIPVKVGGRPNPLNLQYLSSAYNTSSFKHDKLTFHGSFIVAFRNETWIGPNFYSLVDQFFWHWHKYKTLCFGWPFCYRNPRTLEPQIPGWLAKEKQFIPRHDRVAIIVKQRAMITSNWLSSIPQPLTTKIEELWLRSYHYPVSSAANDSNNQIASDQQFKQNCHLI